MSVHVKSSGGMPLCRLEVAIRCPQACLFIEDWIKVKPHLQCVHCQVLMGMLPRPEYPLKKHIEDVKPKPDVQTKDQLKMPVTLKEEGNELPWLGTRIDRLILVRVTGTMHYTLAEFVAGIIMDGDICVYASPELHFCVGCHREVLRKWFSDFNWSAVIVPNPYQGVWS